MANSNSGPAEQLYRSVKRDVERARAGRSASSGTPSGTSRNGGSSRSRSKPSKSRSSRRDAPASSKPRTSSRRDAPASSKPRASSRRDAPASTKPRASSRDGGSRPSGRNGLSNRTPAQRAAFQKMIAARGNGSSRGPSRGGSRGRRDASRGPSRGNSSSRGGSSRPRAGRDDNKAWRGNPDRSRINVNESYERRYWSRALGVSEQDLVETVRRMGGTPTVERVRNALLGRDRARAATTRGARDGRSRPFAVGSRGPSRGRDQGFILR